VNLRHSIFFREVNILWEMSLKPEIIVFSLSHSFAICILGVEQEAVDHVFTSGKARVSCQTIRLFLLSPFTKGLFFRNNNSSEKKQSIFQCKLRRVMERRWHFVFSKDFQWKNCLPSEIFLETYKTWWNLTVNIIIHFLLHFTSQFYKELLR